jgi:hypothetical protein
MGWLDFVASMFGSLVKLAWPAAVFGSVWLFRKRLETLLPRMRVKYGEFDLSFPLQEAERTAAQMPQIGNEIEPTPEETPRLNQIAEISPRAAVLDTRVELESFLSKTVENLKPKGGGGSKLTFRPNSMIESIRFLRNQGVIDHSMSLLLDELRAFGNIASHDWDAVVRIDDAIRYKRLADKVMNQLLSARWHEDIAADSK